MIFEKSSHSCKIYKIIHRDVGLVLSLVEYAYTCCCVVVKYPLVNCYIAIENGTFIVDLPIYLLKIVISHIFMLVYQRVYSHTMVTQQIQSAKLSWYPRRRLIAWLLNAT